MRSSWKAACPRVLAACGMPALLDVVSAHPSARVFDRHSTTVCRGCAGLAMGVKTNN